jgi:hypothetical protein
MAKKVTSGPLDELRKTQSGTTRPDTLTGEKRKLWDAMIADMCDGESQHVRVVDVVAWSRRHLGLDCAASTVRRYLELDILAYVEQGGCADGETAQRLYERSAE